MTKGRSALAATLLAGAVIGVAITASVNRQRCAPAQEGDAVAKPAVLPVASVGGGAIPLPDFTELVNRLSPSIVNISTVSEEEEDQLQRRRDRDPFDFFYHFGPRRSLGSGFVLDASGYIITNHHVVDEATEIVVRLNDEKEYKAEIVGGNAKTDIAVIKIADATGLVPVPLGDSDDLKVGEWVVSPLGGYDATPGWQKALDAAFAAIQPISIDYGVMEKTARPLRCVASLFSWTDVGGWPAMQTLLPRDEQGNAFRGNLKTLDSSGNLVFCETPDEAVTLIGVEDLVVVRAGNRTLEARKNDVDRLRELGDA